MTTTAFETIGPPVEALPLSPAKLHVEGVEPPPPAFLAAALPPQWTAAPVVPAKHARLDGVATMLLAPLAMRRASPSDNALFVSLVAFLVWLGYFAIPGLADSLPLSSWRGMGYMLILLPGSIFASCMLLALGRGFGIACEHLAAKMARRNGSP